MAQLAKHLTVAQVMISWFVSSSPASTSVLTAQNLEPAADSVSSCLSAPHLLMFCVSLSLSKINKYFKKIFLKIKDDEVVVILKGIAKCFQGLKYWLFSLDS